MHFSLFHFHTCRNEYRRVWGLTSRVLLQATIAPLVYALHHGGVSGMSVCHWKQTFMTCGRLDRTVKLWDYGRCALLWTEHFAQDVLDVSMHPTGAYALVALAREVVFHVLHVDGPRVRRRFDVAGCGLVRFSASGHVFALVDGTGVRVYCSITFRERFAYDDHRNTITDLIWTPDNWKLFSCDIDGRICRFDMDTSQKATMVQYNDQNFSGLAISDDLKKMYTIAEDGCIKEIYYKTVIRNKNLEHGPLSAVVLSKTNLMLFVACQNGVVLSISLPIQSRIIYKEFKMHNKRISKMRLSADDAVLITCSVDGSICVWVVENSMTAYAFANKKCSEEVLVSTEMLQRKIDTIDELEATIKRLTAQSASHVAEHKKAHEKRLRDLEHKHSLRIKRIENTTRGIVDYFNEEKMRLENKTDALKKEYEEERQILKDDFEKELEYQNQRYLKQGNDVSDKDAFFKKETEMLIERHNKKIKILTDRFYNELNEKEESFRKFEEQINERKNEFNEILNEFEDQNDREFIKLKYDFMIEIRSLSKKNEKVQIEVDNYKGKLKTAHKRIEETMHLINKYKEDLNKSKIFEKTLNETIQMTTEELQKCNEILNQKETWLQKEKARMLNIQKELLVLDVHEKEQRIMVNPVNERVEYLDLYIHNLNELLTATEQDINELQLKNEKQKFSLNSLVKNISKKEKLIHVLKSFITNIRIDIHYVFVSSDDDTMLRDSLKALYLKYLKVDALDKAIKSGDGMSDMHKQRNMLEKYLTSCQKNVLEYKKKKDPIAKLLEENKNLIVTANNLRREVKANQDKYNDIKSLYGSEISKNTKPKQSTNKKRKDLTQTNAVETQLVKDLDELQAKEAQLILELNNVKKTKKMQTK